MRILQVLIGGLVGGGLAALFWAWQTGRLTVEEAAPLPSPGGAEPVLGYDGMDRDTLIDWLERADLDEDTLERIRRYEQANRNRGMVLQAIDELTG
jgi:hypothetical protein